MERLFPASVAPGPLGLGTPAPFAADKRGPAYTPPPPPAPVYTWSGCYVGASARSWTGSRQHFATAGSTFSNPGFANNLIPAATAITDSFDVSGFIGGFQGGCNWQWGAWVFGIEGDGSATNKSGQAFEGPLVPLFAGSRNWVSQTQERWLVTARARLGWAIWDRTMVYATGGAAWAKIDASEWVFAANGTRPIRTRHLESNTPSGWTVGAGPEAADGYGAAVKGQDLYVKLDQ